MPIIKTPTGERFYVEKAPAEENEGKLPLLLIHGAGSTHLTWPAELRRLSGRRVIAPDLPGHGRSGGGGRSSIVAYADSVRELMDELEIEKAIVLGHSMGGAIALTMAMRMQERVKGLVLMSTGPRLPVNEKLLDASLNNPEQMAAMLNQWMWGDEADEGLKLLSTQQLLMMDPRVVHNDYQACDDFNMEGVISTINQPTLILVGELDRMTPVRFSEKLKASIPNSSLVKVSKAGHMLPLEKPKEVSRAVEAWLNHLEKSRTS